MTARVGGGGWPGGLPTGGQGSKVYVLCAEPKEYKHLRPGTRPGGSGTRLGGSLTGVTEKLFMCQMFFRPLEPPFLETPRTGTEVSRALRARNPKRVRKESERVSQGLRHRGAVESGAHSLGTLGLPGAGGPGTPFRTLFGLFWVSARVWATGNGGFSSKTKGPGEHGAADIAPKSFP